MIVYHGTSARHLDAILKHGILPRHGDRPSNWDVGSATDRVYLTTVYAPYFAHCATEDDEDGVVLEVDLLAFNQGLLVPDEDWLEQTSRLQDFDGVEWAEELVELGNDMAARTHWFRDNVHLFQPSWVESIQALGTVAVAAGVPVDAIRRVSTFSTRSKANRAGMYAAIDPSISLLNYRFMKDKYAALTEWFMGAEVTSELVERITLVPQEHALEEFQKREVRVFEPTA